MKTYRFVVISLCAIGEGLALYVWCAHLSGSWLPW